MKKITLGLAGVQGPMWKLEFALGPQRVLPVLLRKLWSVLQPCSPEGCSQQSRAGWGLKSSGSGPSLDPGLRSGLPTRFLWAVNRVQDDVGLSELCLCVPQRPPLCLWWWWSSAATELAACPYKPVPPQSQFPAPPFSLV